jgi:hypothetical protein
MRLLVPALLAAAVTLAALLHWQSSRIRDLDQQIQTLNGQLRAQSEAANLRMQAQCADQARQTYVDLGFPKGRVAGYSNHYQVKLNRCFIHVANAEAAADGSVWNYQTVLDAFERKEYAAYAGRVDESRPPWEPSRCEVTLPSGKQQSCRSEAEFGELVNVYMEDD